MARRPQDTTYPDWRGGMNTKLAPYLLKPRELTLARNLWYDARGQLEKRPGYVKTCGAELSPPAAKVDGMHVYEYESSNSVAVSLMFWRNGALYRDTDCGVTVPSICSGFTAGVRMRMVNALNNLYFTNGTQNGLVNNTTAFTALGLTVPASAPTLAVGAAGLLTGTYYYKVTYEYGTGGRGESNPSVASASVAPTADQVDLSAIPTGGTGVTKRHLYRTRANDTVYYFVTTISDNTTTTYSDNTSDSALGDELLDDNSSPPNARYMAFNKGIMFYAGNPAARKRLYWSKIGYPEQVPTDNYLDVPVEGDEITGLAILNDGLVVFTNKSFYVLYGASNSSFRFKVSDAGTGCTAPDSIAVYGNAAYALYHHRAFRTFGGPPDWLSDNIENDWLPSNLANLRSAVGIVFRGIYLLSFFVGSTAYASKNGASDDTAANNRVYGLDLVLKEQAEDGQETAWFLWNNIFPSVFAVKRGATVNDETLFWGSNRSTGLTYQLSAGGTSGAFADDGTAITIRMETRAEVGASGRSTGDPKLIKTWGIMWAILRAASGQTLSAYYRFDLATSWSSFPIASKTLEADRGQLVTARFKFPGQANGVYAQVALEESSTSYLLIHTLGISHKPLRFFNN